MFFRLKSSQPRAKNTTVKCAVENDLFDKREKDRENNKIE